MQTIYHPHRDGHVIDSTRPIFYIIQHIRTGIYYAGWKKNKMPFMCEGFKSKVYRTSSKIIHALIDLEGIKAFSIIRIRYFENPHDAHEYEIKFLKRVDASRNAKFYNEANGDINLCHDRTGYKMTPEHKEAIRTSNKANSKRFSEQMKKIAAMRSKDYYEKMFKSRKLHLSEEHKKAISNSRRGKLLSIETIEKLKGLFYWTNGSITVRSRVCPGEGWYRGLSKKHREALSKSRREVVKRKLITDPSASL